MAPRAWLKVVLFATLGALTVRGCAIEDFRIDSNSMLPTLWPGDLVLANKLKFGIHVPFSTYELFRWSEPKVGDIAVFSVPDKAGTVYTKRVVGVGGDRIAIKEGKLYRNSEVATYTPSSLQIAADGDVLVEQLPNQVAYTILKNGALADFGPIDVPANYFFVLGDNRTDSVDSRAWGPIPMSFLKGKLSFTLISFDIYGGVRKGRMGLGL